MKCSNLACMASSGNKVWALKVYKNKDNDVQDRSALFYGADINKSIACYMSQNDILGRGNGMTVGSKYVAIGCAPHRYILRFEIGKESACWSKCSKVATPKALSSISVYKSFQYIVRTKAPDLNASEIYDGFSIGKVSDNTMTLINPFYTHSKVKNIGLYQDIFYDTEKRHLYVVYNLKDSKGRYTKNVIEVFDIGDIPATVYNNCLCYERINAIEIDKSGTEYTKYEVECVGLDADRRMLMAVNIEGTAGSDLSDAIERITNMMF